MNVYELKLKVYLLRDIKNEEALNRISSFIDEVLMKDGKYCKLHEKNCFKNYVFAAFFPIDQKGIYKRNSVYTVVIRTIETDLARYFENQLKDHGNSVMKGLTCDIRIIPKHMIEKVYSLTPVIVKGEDGYWKDNLSFSEFERRLKENLIKKYNAFTGEKINENFQLYSSIKLLNGAPIKVPYKQIYLLGDKVELQVSENTQAQNLIYMSLGVGVLEMNSRGMGYLNYKYYK